MRIHRLALVAGALAMLLVAAACGQKPGVADQAVPVGAIGGQQVAVDPETGEVINTATGEVVSDTTDVLGTGTTSTTTGSSSTTTTATDESDDEAPPASSGGAPTGGSTVGVTDDSVLIGIHAPLTGAAPVPSDSVEKGKDLYFRWIHEQLDKEIVGRRVSVILRNDNYNPSQAVAVCKEMVERNKVFMLSGAAGTDQIAACARYANSAGVPYISAGVTEIGLTGLRTYFTVSMTYPDQGPLLADYMINRLGAKGEKNAMVRFDSQNFEDAHTAFVEAMEDRGVELDYDRVVPKGADATVANTVVQEMRAEGIENAYFLVSPVWFIEVMKAANAQQYDPQFVGVGITMTFDTVLTAACPSGPAIDGAQFFSPFPAFLDTNKYDPDFRRAAQAFYPNKTPDDFMWLSWSAGKGFADMLKLPGQNLTRERFVYYLERARNMSNGIGPTLNFSPTDHFGANQVHVSRATCGTERRWHTILDFESGF